MMQMVKIDEHQYIDADRVLSVHEDEHVNEDGVKSVVVYLDGAGELHPIRTFSPLYVVMNAIGVDE